MEWQRLKGFSQMAWSLNLPNILRISRTSFMGLQPSNAENFPTSVQIETTNNCCSLIRNECVLKNVKSVDCLFSDTSSL